MTRGSGATLPLIRRPHTFPSALRSRPARRKAPSVGPTHHGARYSQRKLALQISSISTAASRQRRPFNSSGIYCEIISCTQETMAEFVILHQIRRSPGPYRSALLQDVVTIADAAKRLDVLVDDQNGLTRSLDTA
jgi:hypothetical protein